MPLAAGIVTLSDAASADCMATIRAPGGEATAGVITVTPAIFAEAGGCAADAGAEASPLLVALGVFTNGAPGVSEAWAVAPRLSDGLTDIGSWPAFRRAEATERAFVPWTAGLPVSDPADAGEAEPAEEPPPSMRGALAAVGRDRPKRTAEMPMGRGLSFGSF